MYGGFDFRFGGGVYAVGGWVSGLLEIGIGGERRGAGRKSGLDGNEDIIYSFLNILIRVVRDWVAVGVGGRRYS